MSNTTSPEAYWITLYRPSSSRYATVHDTAIDLLSGDWECGPTCPQRHTANHNHHRDLIMVRDALLSFTRNSTIMGYAEAVDAFAEIRCAQALMGSEMLRYQCEGERPWSPPGTLAHISARLLLSDREAIAAAYKKDQRHAAKRAALAEAARAGARREGRAA